MKHLREYTEQATTELLKKYGAFFAFSNKQFDEQKQESVKYASLGAGLICPVEHAKAFTVEFKEITATGIKADLSDNGKKGVIHRELGNHEYSYNQDITDTVGSLGGYGITAEEINELGLVSDYMGTCSDAECISNKTIEQLQAQNKQLQTEKQLLINELNGRRH